MFVSMIFVKKNLFFSHVQIIYNALWYTFNVERTVALRDIFEYEMTRNSKKYIQLHYLPCLVLCLRGIT